jgi:hypothetical protein|tara:strand:+ start:279 stop:413 length:135 start_codon:yes stop_codon:yes gene_type:complete
MVVRQWIQGLLDGGDCFGVINRANCKRLSHRPQARRRAGLAYFD